MKRMIKNVSAVVLLLALVSTALAASHITFVVHDVNITADLSYTDTNDTNPFKHDSVKAETTSSSAMDTLGAEATIYFYNGSSKKTVTEEKYNNNCTSVSVTAKATGIDVGYKGTGYHYAKHASYSGSRNTGVTW